MANKSAALKALAKAKELQGKRILADLEKEKRKDRRKQKEVEAIEAEIDELEKPVRDLLDSERRLKEFREDDSPTEPISAYARTRKQKEVLVNQFTSQDKDIVLSKGGELMNRSTVDHSYQRLMDQISRDELENALALETADKFQKFLGLMQSSSGNLVSLAKRCGISQLQFVEMMRRSSEQRAVMRMIQGLPEVAEDLVEDSKSKKGNCPKCDGYGDVIDDRAMVGEGMEPVYRVCPECHGKKSRHIPGDSDSRKLLFEATGQLKKAPMVSINQSFGASSFGPSFKDLDEWDKGRYATAENVIDAEPVEAEKITDEETSDV